MCPKAGINTILFGKNKYIWRLKTKSMSWKKYMSKSLIMRLTLLLLMVGAAAIFDMVHASDHSVAKASKTPVSDEASANKTFFCNQVPSFNLKTSFTEFSLRCRFASTQDKFLIKYYNLRTFQMMKAEAIHSSFSVLCQFHSFPFNRILYSSPDDTPPLA